jgi:hypothetical protein
MRKGAMIVESDIDTNDTKEGVASVINSENEEIEEDGKSEEA